MPRSSYCFFCSRIRSRDFEKTSYFLDTVIDQRDFEENFCEMIGSLIELDISGERPVYFSDYIEKDSQCDYYQKIYKPGNLLVCFTSVLVRLYVNYVLNCLFELDLTLRDERILVDEVYTFASDLMYELFNTNYLFFYEVFNFCCSEDLNFNCCYAVLREKVHYGAHYTLYE